jgi:hypothetical protein
MKLINKGKKQIEIKKVNIKRRIIPNESNNRNNCLTQLSKNSTKKRKKNKNDTFVIYFKNFKY